MRTRRRLYRLPGKTSNLSKGLVYTYQTLCDMLAGFGRDPENYVDVSLRIEL